MGDVLGRGIAMTYLSIVALIPLAAVVAKSLDSGVGSFWDAITTDQALMQCGFATAALAAAT
mgnify:CR=1 FL=1